MYDVGIAKQRLFDAYRGPHSRITRVEHRNLITGDTFRFKLNDGSCTEDNTSDARWSLTCTLPPEQSTWDRLDTIGSQLVVTQDIRFTDGHAVTVPMGVYLLEDDALDYSPGGALTLDGCPDQWSKIAGSPLPIGQRTSVASNTAWQEIRRLMAGAWNTAFPFPGWASNVPLATPKVGYLYWEDGDRAAAIKGLAKANGLDVYFDRNGLGVIRPVPMFTDSATPDVMIAAGRGVMLGASRTRKRSQIRNVIVVTSSAPDATFLPVEVRNDDPNDPASTAGPLGYRSENLTRPEIRTSAQAQTAGAARLSQTRGAGKQLQLTTAGMNVADAYDVAEVTFPQIDRNRPRPRELHVLDTIQHPFMPDGTQSVSTRSTIPDADTG